MKINFLLKDLEFHLEDQLLERGEQLISDGLLSPVMEIERNLWTLQSLSLPVFEVEIQISPSKVKAYTCDCPESKERKICKHIAAGLLLVRNQRKESEAKKVKRQKQKQTRAPKRLTTTTILDHIGLEELKDFIKAYAKENKNFSIALKARFAPTVSLPDSLEKYTHLLDSTINSVRRQALRFSKKASIQILKVSEEILHHGEDALLTKNYSESFAICHSVFSKIIPLLPKAEDKKDFNSIVHRNFKLLQKLIHSQLAPQLKEQIWEYLCTEAFAPLSRLTGFDQHFVHILMDFSQNSITWSQQTEHLIDLALEDTSLNQHSHIHLLLAKMNLLDRSNQVEAFNQLIHENLSNPEILQLAVVKAKENEDLNRRKQLATLGLENLNNSEYHDFFEENLLEVAIAKKDKRGIKKWAFNRFLKVYDFKYVTLLKSYFVKNWEKVRSELIKKLEQQVFTISKRDALAKILADEGLIDQLFQYLSTIRSLDLLPQYDQLLNEKYRTEMQALYKSLIADYLNSHLGRQSALKVKQLLWHLQNNGEKRFMDRLVRHFGKLYSDRPSLIEELKSLY